MRGREWLYPNAIDLAANQAEVDGTKPPVIHVTESHLWFGLLWSLCCRSLITQAYDKHHCAAHTSFTSHRYGWVCRCRDEYITRKKKSVVKRALVISYSSVTYFYIPARLIRTKQTQAHILLAGMKMRMTAPLSEWKHHSVCYFHTKVIYFHSWSAWMMKKGK